MLYLYLIEALFRGERWAKRRAVEGILIAAMGSIGIMYVSRMQ